MDGVEEPNLSNINISSFQDLRNLVEQQVKLNAVKFAHDSTPTAKHHQEDILSSQTKIPPPPQIKPENTVYYSIPKSSSVSINFEELKRDKKIDVTDFPKTEGKQSIANKLNSHFKFKLTGKKWSSILETLIDNNVDNSDLNSYPIYDYFPSDILNVKVEVSSNSASTGSSSSEDNSCDYMTMKAMTDLREMTVIRDFSFKDGSNVSSLRLNNKVYYDQYQNPRIERLYKSVIDGPQNKLQPKHQQIINEIFTSEYKFVIELGEHYRNYILYFMGDPKRKLSKLDPFFKMYESLYTNQEIFYKKLIIFNTVGDIANHLIKNEDMYALYKNYIMNLNTATYYINSEYRFQILKRKQDLCDQTTLEQHLLLPRERLNEYISLMKEIRGHMEQNWQISSKLTLIIKTIKKLLSSATSDAKLLDCILSRPPSLLNYGNFIMKDTFYVKKITPNTKVTVFLFQEVLIFTTSQECLYSYKHSILMSDLYVRVISENPLSFEVMNFHTAKDKENANFFRLETPDPRTKEIWVEVIEALLWEQLMACKKKSGEKS